MDIQNVCSVVSNKKICGRFYHMALDAKAVAAKVQSGQFIHMRIQKGLEPFFRRPFSVFRAKKYVEILYEVVGPGTALLAERKKGDILDILGPLGNSFSMPGKNIKQVVMVAGGIGVAPFLSLADTLKNKKIKMVLLYGGKTRGHVFDMKAFKDNGCMVHVATDDGSVGKKGRVSVLYSKIEADAATTRVYTCGPRPMMADVQRFAKKYSLKGEASCEEVMACGLGACLGCIIKTTSGYKRVCYDGPVFDLQEVVFET